jgi:hypothetical protein
VEKCLAVLDTQENGYFPSQGGESAQRASVHAYVARTAASALRSETEPTANCRQRQPWPEPVKDYLARSTRAGLSWPCPRNCPRGSWNQPSSLPPASLRKPPRTPTPNIPSIGATSTKNCNNINTRLCSCCGKSTALPNPKVTPTAASAITTKAGNVTRTWSCARSIDPEKNCLSTGRGINSRCTIARPCRPRRFLIRGRAGSQQLHLC